MYASNFIFDGKMASDFGLVICSFDDNMEPVTGGEIELIVKQPVGVNTFSSFGYQIPTALQWNFSIIKNPCGLDEEDKYFAAYEESEIAKWLLNVKGYRWIQFLSDDEYDTIYYKAYINMSPVQPSGRTIGYNISVISNCGYGFSCEKHKTSIINSQTPMKIYLNNDIDDYVLPFMKISGNGNFFTYSKTKTAKNISKEITIDSENEIISGINFPDDFSWYFPRLVAGKNVIETDSQQDIKISISYREIKRVIA